MPDRPERPDRLEREIEEILDRIERFPDADARRARRRRRGVQRFGAKVQELQHNVMRELSRISMSQVVLISFLLILGSFFFRRFNPVLMQWALYAGIALFVTSFAILMFSRGAGGTVQQRWRGRTVEYRAGGSGPVQRLRRWWASRARRR
ncbi:MAG: hypothetical protein GEU80_05925 [Dehalococcoidia bacterium]|nr:hypothetical protein [Dehalococcoidia bacterium]